MAVSIAENSKKEPVGGDGSFRRLGVCVSNWVEVAPRVAFLRARGNELKEDDEDAD